MTFKPAVWPRKLRSQHWYGGTSKDSIYHHGWLKNQGHPADLFDGRPIIGILNTWSDLTPCNGHLRDLAEKVKAGVWAATPHLMVHRGRAVVFEDIDDYKAQIDDDALDIDETCIMVLKNCGPKSYPGMAEVGNMSLPSKVLKKGITDMVRISDARMSGTAYGTVVLHTSPEAAAGGPLAVVRNGDMIVLDVPGRRLHLEVSDAELAARLAEWAPREVPPPADMRFCTTAM